MKAIVLMLFISFQTSISWSQCCSSGNPVGGSTNIGILDKGTLRAISFYRFSESSGYWEGDKKSDFDFVKNARFNFTGITLGYGITNKLSVETEIGYYITKTQEYNITPSFTNRGFGFSNQIVSLKYNLILNELNPLEWTVGLGAKFPYTTNYQIVDNVELPRDVQPSTHAFGVVLQSFLYKSLPKSKLKLFLINRFETNSPDKKNFKYGNALINSFFVSRPLGTSNWTGIFQLRNEYRIKDVKNVSEKGFVGFSTIGQEINASGGVLFFVAPQINYTIAKKWNISVLLDLPVYRNYNGSQLGNKYSFAINLSRDFGETECEIIE